MEALWASKSASPTADGKIEDFDAAPYRVVWRALRDEGARSATSGCRFRRIPARVPATAHGPGRAKMGFGIPPGPSIKSLPARGIFASL